MPDVLSIKEAAQELGIPQVTVYGFLNDGTLAFHKYNRRLIRIARADLETFRRRHYIGARSEWSTELSDGRTHPTSFDIRAPRQQPQPQVTPHAEPDRVTQRLDELQHRVDLLEGRLAGLIEYLFPPGDPA